MLTAPFTRAHLADPFGDWPQWRKDMGLGPHRGADWNGLDMGTPIPASGSGRVVWRTNLTDEQAENTALGHRIVVAYPVAGGEIRIGYNHLHRNPTLGVGYTVELGDHVGLLGNSGSASTGEHLHMTASWETGDPGTVAVVDPIQFLTFGSAPAGGAQIPIRTNSEEETMTVAIVDYGTAQPYPGKHVFRVGEEAIRYLPESKDTTANAKADGGTLNISAEEFTRICAARGIPIGQAGEPNVPHILLTNGKQRSGSTFWSRARSNSDALTALAKRIR